MRPLALTKFEKIAANVRARRKAMKCAWWLTTLGAGAGLCGCAQGSGGGIAPPPPPPGVQISVTPPAESVTLGNMQTFVATVTNTSNTAVTWSVNGVTGGSSAAGSITSAGMYTAPSDLPAPASVQVTATSAADPAKSATASVTIVSDIVVQIAPNVAGVELGAIQAFSGSVMSAGHPDTSLRWSVSGAACPNACGAVDARGNFTAPQVLPSPAGGGHCNGAKRGGPIEAGIGGDHHHEPFFSHHFRARQRSNQGKRGDRGHAGTSAGIES